MSRWQLRRIIIYSHDGRHEVVSLKPSSVNVVVGDSNTGKSALLEIINYCMGSKDCDIADHVQKHCPWVAIQWVRDGEYCLLARKIPSPGHKQGPLAFDIRTGKKGRFPADASTFQNNGIGALRRFEELLGIGHFILHDAPSPKKQPFTISARHAAPYVFLSDDTIINKKVLFTGGSGFRLNHLKDTLPYFLGIVDEEFLRKKTDLDNARKEKRRIAKELKEASRIVSQGSSRVDQFLQQALDLGILAKETPLASEQDKTAALQNVVAWRPGKFIPVTPTSELGDLQQREENLLSKLSALDKERKAVKQSIHDAERFRNSVSQQANRLKSIELLKKTNEREECPLCHGFLAKNTEPIGRLENALEALSQDIGEVQTDQPKMDGYLRKLSKNIEEIRKEYRFTRSRIEILISKDEQVEKQRSLNELRLHLSGMVDLFLQSMEQKETKGQSEKLRLLEEQIEALEADIDPEAQEESMQAVAQGIAFDAKKILDSLPFDEETRKRPLVFDYNKMQYHQLDGTRLVRMPIIGSDENHLSLHIAFYLVLHRLFAQNHRPVPGIIVMDQVSRPYFPKEKYKEMVKLSEGSDDTAFKLMDEREKVKQIFDLLFNEVERAEDLQILVLEKAYFQEDERYTGSVEKIWPKPKGLVPADWPVEPTAR